MLNGGFVVGLVLFASGAPAVDPQPAVQPADQAKKEKLICRREVPIGSLIATRKTCLTALQWQKQAEDAQAELERMNPHLSTEHGH